MFLNASLFQNTSIFILENETKIIFLQCDFIFILGNVELFATVHELLINTCSYVFENIKTMANVNYKIYVVNISFLYR